MQINEFFKEQNEPFQYKSAISLITLLVAVWVQKNTFDVMFHSFDSEVCPEPFMKFYYISQFIGFIGVPFLNGFIIILLFYYLSDFDLVQTPD